LPGGIGTGIGTGQCGTKWERPARLLHEIAEKIKGNLRNDTGGDQKKWGARALANRPLLVPPTQAHPSHHFLAE